MRRKGEEGVNSEGYLKPSFLLKKAHNILI